MTENFARVDDVLVRRHVLTLRIRQLLADREFESIRLSEFQRLLDEIRTMPADVRLHRLIQSALGDTNRLRSTEETAHGESVHQTEESRADPAYQIIRGNLHVLKVEL